MDYFEDLTDADIAAFIEANEWKFAKTMARIPHAYCLKERCTDPDMSLIDWKMRSSRNS